MSGTNFISGVACRKKYSGNVATPELKNRAATKLIQKQAIIHCLGSDANNVEVTTEFTLPAKAIVTAVWLNVITGETNSSVDVGHTSDANGYINTQSLGSAGIIVPRFIVTTGINESYLSSIQVGTLLARSVTGSDLATDHGLYVPRFDHTSGGETITYTCNSGTTEAVFDIIVDYFEVVEEIN